MDSLVWNIEKEEKQELISLLRSRYDDISDLDSDSRIPYSNLKQHEKGELNAIGLANVADLIKTVNTSVSRFSHNFPEDFITGTFDYSERRVSIPEDLQTTLFRTFSVDGIEELTDRSRQTVNRMRIGESKRIPEKDYETVFEEVNSELDRDFSAKGVLEYAGNGEELFEATENDILEIQEIRDHIRHLEEHEPYKTGRAKNSISSIGKVIKTEKDLIKPDGKTEGYTFSVLEELGLMEKWGGKASPYEIKKPPEYFKIVKSELEKGIEKDKNSIYTRKELTALLDDIKTLPTKNQIDERDDLPSSRTYENVFGSWNNAMWCAGFDPNEQIYTEDELLDQLYEMNDKLGRRPERKVFLDSDKTASRKAVENHFGTYEEFTATAGLYDIGLDEKLERFYINEKASTAVVSD